MGSVRFTGCMAAGLALALAPRWARAAETTLRLRWTAPAECPPEADVHAAALRGVDPSSLEGALDADAVVEKRADGDVAKPWRLRLTTRRANRTGEREIEASTCAGVADAAAVLLGLALARAEAAPRSEEPTVAPERAGLEPDAVKAPARSPALAVGASGALDTAALPALAMGAALSAAWTPGRVRLELEGRMLASQSATLRASAAGADLAVVTLGGRGCFAVIRGGAVDLSPCVGTDVQFASATGYGAERNFDASARWTAMTAGLLLRAPLATWLAVRGRAELAVPLSRPEFVVQNEGSVHRPSAASGLLTAGLEANFL